MGSKNMSTTNSPIVQCMYLYIMKVRGYMMGENYSTRGGKMIPVIFVRYSSLMIC